MKVSVLTLASAASAAAAIAVSLAGCRGKTCEGECGEDPGWWSSRTNAAATYLCVGMERSARFGSCPGCKKDAEVLSSIMDGLGYTGDTLVSEKATKANVEKMLRNGVSSTQEGGLFLFFYSGHGGQEYLGGKEPDGADRQDEYLCLYDTHMLDDEIWEIVSSCKGRVFLYFDACHSATLYRSVASDLSAIRGGDARALSARCVMWSSGFTFDPSDFVQAGALSVDSSGRAVSSRILCWSGCREAEFSYGASAGGVMTRAVVRNWKPGVSYDGLWTLVYSDVQREQKDQHPVQTSLGALFTGMEAFK